MDDNYPPYIFRDSSGALVGYLVDVWKLWQTKTGVPVDLQASDWDQAKRRMQSGKAAVIDTIFQTPEREQTLDFTPAYAQIPVSIYSHKGIGGIAGLDNLKGFLVGVKAGDACIDTLTQAGIVTLQAYANYEALVQAALAGQVKIFCLDEPPANYLLYRDHAEDTFNKAFQLSTGEFHRAVHKGDGQTLALLNRGFSAISAAEDPAGQRQLFALPGLCPAGRRTGGPGAAGVERPATPPGGATHRGTGRRTGAPAGAAGSHTRLGLDEGRGRRVPLLQPDV
jgi:ABC-type amino acid transport substrate-binding protein